MLRRSARQGRCSLCYSFRMDRTRLEYHLAQAESRVIEGENHIARQRQTIGRLAKDIGQLANGARDLKAAQAVLAQLQATQASLIAERDRLRAELAIMKSARETYLTLPGVSNGGHCLTTRVRCLIVSRMRGLCLMAA
jgi:uncharacterized coiled-coil protein SlyX